MSTTFSLRHLVWVDALTILAEALPLALYRFIRRDGDRGVGNRNLPHWPGFDRWWSFRSGMERTMELHLLRADLS